MKYNLAVGGSCIVSPSGLFVAGPVFGEETIVWAEVDLEERELAKAYLDGVGHYARPDLLTLGIRDEAWTPTGPEKLTESRLESTDIDQMLRLLRRYQISPEELEAILAGYGEV
jgi:hypothetical protein